MGSILVPEWINPLFAQTPVPRIASADGGSGGINLSPSSLEPAGTWKTVFRLPLSGSRPSSTATGVCEFARELICPHASIFDYRRLVKTSKRLFSPVGEPSSYLEVVTIEETCLASPNSEVLPPIPTVTNKHQWLVFTRKFRVDPDQLRRLGCHSKVTLKHTSISIGINLSDTSPPTEYPVYAFLPVRSAGFSFLLNADFDLTSSREDVDGTSVWNRWLVGQLPTVFENLLQAIAEVSFAYIFPDVHL
ncbi:unnamed protein product [Dibothriocephalus latus]|uniref:Uncharacterized protein n=1 Tax=Dibothriocephalus latus TaxID=60516 RepID=A0A3P7NHN0_DIBLA|nr:unnamed protein product [Dibothriocephalus latus]